MCGRSGERINDQPHHFRTLIITVDNSFDGKTTAQEGRFLSRKHTDFGIGTASVTAVAKKHGGETSFEADKTVFKASVYVQV